MEIYLVSLMVLVGTLKIRSSEFICYLTRIECVVPLSITARSLAIILSEFRSEIGIMVDKIN